MKTRLFAEKTIRLSLCFVLLTISCNLFSHLPDDSTEPKVTEVEPGQTLEPENPKEGTSSPVVTEESPVPLSQGPLFAVFEEFAWGSNRCHPSGKSSTGFQQCPKSLPAF